MASHVNATRAEDGGDAVSSGGPTAVPSGTTRPGGGRGPPTAAPTATGPNGPVAPPLTRPRSKGSSRAPGGKSDAAPSTHPPTTLRSRGRSQKKSATDCGGADRGASVTAPSDARPANSTGRAHRSGSRSGSRSKQLTLAVPAEATTSTSPTAKPTRRSESSKRRNDNGGEARAQKAPVGDNTSSPIDSRRRHDRQPHRSGRSSSKPPHGSTTTAAVGAAKEHAQGTAPPAGPKKKCKKAVQQHPLRLLPKEPWRVRWRAFFFPVLHREALAVNDEPVPARPPRFGDWFEHLNDFAIFVNIIVLALYDPYDNPDGTRYKTLLTFQVVLTFMFQFEIVVRVVSLGWNRMVQPVRLIDAVIVLLCTAAVIASIAGYPNRIFGFTVVRSLRILRPLRNLGAFPALLILVDALSHVIFKIFDVALLFIAFLTVFSVTGLSLFQGTFLYHCVNSMWFNQSQVAVEYGFNSSNILDYVCGSTFDTTVLNITTPFTCYPSQLCDPGIVATFLPRGYHCPWGYTCMQTMAENGGLWAFDNFIQSLWMMFDASSGQTWYSIGAMGANVTDSFAWVFVVVFFLCVIFLSTLMVVVITVDFDVARERAEKSMKEQQSGAIADGSTKFQSLVQTLVLRRRALVAGAVKSIENNLDAVGKKMHRSKSLAGGRAAAEIGVAGSRNPPKRSLASKSSALIAKVQLLLTKHVVNTQFFDWTSKSLILINLGLMAYVHYGMSPAVGTVLSTINVYLVIAFCVENVIRIAATPLKDFFSEKMNIFDSCINVLSIVDIALDVPALQFLQVFRALRVVRLLRFSPKLYETLLTLFASIKSSPIVLCLLFFAVFIFAIISMQLLGGKFCGLDPNGENDPPNCYNRPRKNFDTFGTALLTCWIIITGDNWDDSMYAAMNDPQGGYGYGLYFSIYYFVANNILLAFFGGVMLSAKTTKEQSESNEVLAAKKQASELTDAFRGDQQVSTVDKHLAQSAFAYEAKAERRAAKQSRRMLESRDQSAKDSGAAILAAQSTSSGDARAAKQTSSSSATNTSAANGGTTSEVEMTSIEVAAAPSRTSDGRHDPAHHASVSMPHGGDESSTDDDDDDDEHSDEETDGLSAQSSMAVDADESHAARAIRSRKKRRKDRLGRRFDSFVSGQYSQGGCATFVDRARMRLQPVLSHWVYSFITGAIILAACVAMAVDDPIAAPDTVLSRTVATIDITLRAFYIFDTALNFFVFGVIMDSSSYLRRNKWNVFDFALTFIGTIAFIVQPYSTIGYRVLTSLLALRPLSLVKRSPGMRLVAQALSTAIYEMRYVFIAILGLVVMVAIMGVQLLMGKMRSCVIQGNPMPQYPLTNCTALGGTWDNTGPNFDNVLEALYSLFLVIMLELWSPMMFQAMDYTEPGQPSFPNANRGVAVYFVVFSVIGGVIMTNLMMSVLVGAYNRCKRSAGAQKSLRTQREQNGWESTNKRILRALPNDAKVELVQVDGFVADALGGIDKALKLVDNEATAAIKGGWIAALTRARRVMRDVVESQRWYWATVVLTLANFIVMVMDYVPSPPTYEANISKAEDAFTIMFAIEAVVKIMGEGFSAYVASNWNRLDFFVVIMSLFGEIFKSVVNARVIALFRSFRILRLAKIIKGRSTLGELIHKFGMAVASLGPVSAVIFIVQFAFAIIAKQLFGHVRFLWRGDDTTGDFNFAYIGHALVTMLRITFGGNWSNLCVSMWPLPPVNCDPNIGDCAAGAWLVQLFFVVYIAFSNFVLKNLMVAVLVDSFSSSADIRSIKKPQAKLLVHAWKACDPELTMRVRGFDVLPVLRSLPPSCPIGFRSLPQAKRVAFELRFLYMLRIVDPKSHENGVRFVDFVDLLCHFAYFAPPPEKRFFRKKLPTDCTDDQARLSATLIMINEVAKRVIRARRERRSARASDGGATDNGSLVVSPAAAPTVPIEPVEKGMVSTVPSSDGGGNPRDNGAHEQSPSGSASKAWTPDTAGRDSSKFGAPFNIVATGDNVVPEFDDEDDDEGDIDATMTAPRAPYEAALNRLGRVPLLGSLLRPDPLMLISPSRPVVGNGADDIEFDDSSDEGSADSVSTDEYFRRARVRAGHESPPPPVVDVTSPLEERLLSS